jgi:hypothetical protein
MHQEITELCNIWQSIVACDHHKDRDCHWGLDTIWSYGQSTEYIIHHDGYLYKEVDEKFDTYTGAVRALITHLIAAITERFDSAKAILAEDSTDESDIQKKILSFEEAFDNLVFHIDLMTYLDDKEGDAHESN